MRKIVPRMLLGAASLLISCLLAEMMVAWLWPQPLVQQAFSSKRGGFLEPGSYTNRHAEFEAEVYVNQHGFIDSEWLSDPQTTIFLIGDSFVASTQVDLDEGWGRIIENNLNDSAPNTDLRCLGMPGAGTTSELAFLQDIALPTQPDLILLSIFSSNDVANNHPVLDYQLDKPFAKDVDGELQIYHPTEPQTSGFLWQHSHLIRWVQRVQKIREIAASRLKHGKDIPLDLRIYDPDASPKWEEAWTLTETLLEKFIAAAKEQGVPVGIILVPAREQASQVAKDKMMERWPLTKGWDTLASHKRMYQLVSKLAPTLDLLPSFQAHPAPESLYFQRDGHWTIHGHKLAANKVSAFIEELQNENL